MLQKAHEADINVNCVDPLGRSALLMAIDNENLEMVELLIEHKVDTKDALLHAISEEFVEAVEVLLEHEESLHRNGEPHVSPFATYSVPKFATERNGGWGGGVILATDSLEYFGTKISRYRTCRDARRIASEL